MSGAGNDFVLIDKKINPETELNAEFINKICQRRTGIGADGVLLIEDNNSPDYTVKYFNSDGSTGSLCANGARCAIKYGKESGRFGSSLINFTVNGKDYSGQAFENGLVKFYLGSPSGLKSNFKIKAGSQLINASYVNTGSPHVVIKIQDVLRNNKDLNSFYTEILDFPVFELGKEIRYSRDFAPEGTNVNFVDVKDGVIKIRSYERGVEEETLSCGTGSVASSIILFVNEGMQPPIKLIAKSGAELVVDFKYVNNKFEDLSITGPAEVTFKGELTIN
jgi:diaminopimelate epimerase